MSAAETIRGKSFALLSALASASCGLQEPSVATATGRSDASVASREETRAGQPAARRPINGTKLYVKRVGQGEPILVVHGGPMLEHGYLAGHLQPLSATHELIFFDQRLSGRSAGEVPVESVRLATFVDDIEALRKHLGLGRVHVLGHSWGGLLAMRYAIRYGENLRSLILLDSMSASSKLAKEENELLAARLTYQDKLAAAALRAKPAFVRRESAAIREVLLQSFEVQFHDRSLIDRLQLYVPPDIAARSRQFGAMMVDLKEYDFHAELRRIQVPTLVLYGASEPTARLTGAALHSHLPHSKFVEIEGAGHFPFIEQPAAFHREVAAFLASVLE